jgi:TP901 family phage tail tape measure protein
VDRVLRAVITGSSAGAVRAFSETAAASDAAAGEMSSRFDKATAETSGFLGRIGSAMQSAGIPFGSAVADMGNKVGETENKSKGLFGTLSTLGGVTLAAGAAGFAAVAVESVKLGESFQKTVAQIASNADIPISAAQKIGNAFLATAGTTEFSAQTIGTAYAQVAGQLKATEGHALSAAQAMSVMKASMDLAEASGTDLGSSTSSLSAVMQAYGLSTKDAASAADTLFNISRATATPVSSLTTIIDRLHGRLGELAPSLQDVGTLMAFPQVAAQGSRGAMIVNTALQTLLGGSKATSAELKTLGVNLFDASGKFIGMKGVVEQLGPALSHMTQQQQMAAEKTLFGASAAQLMGQVMQAGPAVYDKAAAEVSKVGTAHDGAAKQAGTLKVQMETLKATAEDLGTRFGDFLIPKLEDLARIVSGVITWFEKHKAVAEVLAGVIGGVLATAVAVFTINLGAKMVKSVQTAMENLGKLSTSFFGSGAAATAASEETTTALAATGAAEEEFAATSEAVGEASSAAFGPIGIAIMAVVVIGTLLATHWKLVEGWLKDAWNAIKGAAVAVWDALVGFFKKWGEDILMAFLPVVGIPVFLATHWHQVEDDAKAIWGDIVHFFEAIPGRILGALGAGASLLLKWGGDVIRGLLGGITTAATDLWNWWLGLNAKILGYLGDAGRWLLNIGKNIIEGLVHGIENGIGLIGHAMGDVVSKIKGFITNPLSIFSPSRVFAGYGQNLMEGLAQGIAGSANLPAGAIASVAAQLARVPLGNISASVAAGGTSNPALIAAAGGAAGASPVGAAPGGSAPAIIQLTLPSGEQFAQFLIPDLMPLLYQNKRLTVAAHLA